MWGIWTLKSYRYKFHDEVFAKVNEKLKEVGWIQDALFYPWL